MVLVKSQRAGERVKAQPHGAISTERLKLPVNEHKSQVATIDAVRLSGIHLPEGQAALVGRAPSRTLGAATPGFASCQPQPASKPVATLQIR